MVANKFDRVDMYNNNKERIRDMLDICLAHPNMSSVIAVNVPIGGGHLVYSERMACANR